jgi:hypothetical protein
VLADLLHHVVDLLPVQKAILVVIVSVEDEVELLLQLRLFHGAAFAFAVVVVALAVGGVLLAAAHLFDFYWLYNYDELIVFS